MSWWKKMWKKPTSFSAHAGWGAWLALAAGEVTHGAVWPYVIPAAVGTLWEVGGEAVTRAMNWWTFVIEKKPVHLAIKPWKTRTWDIVPWAIAGIASAAVASILGW